MRYRIHHTTEYSYHEAVTLQPHIIRLRPRSDGTQSVRSFQCTVTPQPQQQSDIVDLDGNALIKVWFERQPTQSLLIQTISEIETYRENPFTYLLEPWAIRLPIDYPTSLLTQLQPYLAKQHPGTANFFDHTILQLAQDIWLTVEGNITNFLTHLSEIIYKQCQYSIRETGDPLPPELTWRQKAGSCRDFAVLFVEVCRAIGLAARFVSGYQDGGIESSKTQAQVELHLHAWAEVYLPGAGWRGYDPTQGLAVRDRHIALVASAYPQYAAPILGAFTPGFISSQMSYKLAIDLLDVV